MSFYMPKTKETRCFLKAKLFDTESCNLVIKGIRKQFLLPGNFRNFHFSTANSNTFDGSLQRSIQTQVKYLRCRF